MQKKNLTILAINPGTKCLGIAVFQNADLRDWRIKAINGKWSQEKLEMILSIISNFISRYQPDAIALKEIHPSRSSDNLNGLYVAIQKLAQKRRLLLRRYSIKDLEKFYSPGERINKRQLAEIIGIEYPALLYALESERNHKNRYFIRMFEAVALGAVCLEKCMNI
jgi:Holliday junction resolvasome RuvABC endonuclease subunit